MASWPPCNTWEGRPASRSPSVRVRFDPVPRVDGIEASGDPLTAVRADIYPLSGRRRRGRLRRREALIGRKGTHLFVNGHTSADDRKETVQMTCKIERQADEHHTTLRLIGYLQAAHLEALQAHMESNGPRIVLTSTR